MQKIKKLIISIIVIFCLIFSMLKIPAFADVGDFESYDSGSDWSSSDWSSSSSDWDSDWDWDSGSSSSSSSSYGSGYRSSGGVVVTDDGFLKAFIFIITIILIVCTIVSLTNKNKTVHNLNYRQVRPTPEPEKDEEQVEALVQAIDPNFNKEEFKTWAGDLFVKLQYAWSDRDWEVIRCFETPELFEQHSAQLQRYVKNKQINKLERVSVSGLKLHEFEQDSEKETISVVLNSKMIDYIIDETTGAVLKGDKNTNKYNAYILKFVRKTGTKTESINGTESTVKTMNCPNCGAPTEITSSGKCPYCGSIITTEDHNWSLSGLDRYMR